MSTKTLSEAQKRALAKLSTTEPRSAYQVKESLATLNALVSKGCVKKLHPGGAGGIFSPQTFFKFRKIG